MTDFPKTIDCGDFRLEKVAPTFDTARIFCVTSQLMLRCIQN